MPSSKKYAVNEESLLERPGATRNMDTFNVDIRLDPLEDLDADIPFTAPPQRKPENEANTSHLGPEPSARVLNALQYRGVADHFDIDPDVVYHPAPRTQVAPSAAFPDANVLYVDIESDHTDLLNENGYLAVQGDADNFDLEAETGRRADLIIYYDATNVDLEAATEGNLAKGGWIISDERYQTADVLDDLEMKAKVRFSEDGLVEIDTQNLEWYNEPVESEEQYSRQHPELYEEKRSEVDRRIGEEIELLEGLKEVAKLEAMDDLHNFAKNSRRMIQSPHYDLDQEGDSDRIEYLLTKIENPDPHLPMKKYGDQLTVFQRK